MTKEDRNPKDESFQKTRGSSFAVRSSSFVIRHFGRYFREWSVALALCTLLLLLALWAPGFFKRIQLLSTCTTAVPVLIVACGVALVIICRQIDISVGSQFTLCSVLLGLLVQA